MKKILIIGAGFLQDFVICKAKEMGYETLAVDLDPNAIGFTHADKYKVIDIVDERACLKYAQEENVDGVLTAATDYGVLTSSFIAEKMGLRGIPYSVAKLIKNKYLIRKCLYENHVDDTAKCYEVDCNTNIEELISKLTFPVMVKPSDGSGSRGTTRVNQPEKFMDACHKALVCSLIERAEIEPFISGVEYGAESLVIDGQVHVMSIMKKNMTLPPYFAELGHAIPSELSPKLEDKAVQCVKNAIKALGITCGSVNIDMLISEDGKIFIIDVGARMGGNMIGPCIIPYGTGLNYLENMIRNAVGDPIVWIQDSHEAVASRLLAFNKSGVVKNIPDFHVLEEDFDVEIYHHLHVGDFINEYHTNIDGCGYIIAKRSSVKEAESVCAEVLNEIGRQIF